MNPVLATSMGNSSDLDTQWLARLLKKAIHDEKPVEMVSAHAESAVAKGENYASTVMRVKFKMITASGSRKSYSVIVKFLPSHLKKIRLEWSTFRNEIKMFTTILPQMEALMEEFEDKRDTLWAKYYGGEPYSLMALEDLKERNYTLTDRKQWQSLDHALLVLRSVGRYHAMTKVLMTRGLISSSSDKGSYFGGVTTVAKRNMFEGCLHLMSKAMLNGTGSWGTSTWGDIGQRVKNQIPLLCDTTENLYLNYNKDFEVLNHGDLWTSNMMFKTMEYTNKPIAVKLVDYQIPHMNSFIWDVTYYMYSSVVPSVRRANYDTLLEAYHQSLSDNLKFFKFSGYVPTLDDVKNEAIRLRPAAFAFVVFVLPVTTGTTKEAIKLELVSAGVPPETLFDEFIFSEPKLVREIGDDLKDFAKLQII